MLQNDAHFFEIYVNAERGAWLADDLNAYLIGLVNVGVVFGAVIVGK